MNTAQKTRKVIIIATVGIQMIAFGASLQAAEPCRPDGFCPLPSQASDQKAALRIETRKAALKNLLKKQLVQCDSLVSTKLATALNEMNGLQKQIILKALETGLLLQLPSIVKEFMQTNSSQAEGKQFCSSGPRVLFSKRNGLSSES